MAKGEEHGVLSQTLKQPENRTEQHQPVPCLCVGSRGDLTRLRWRHDAHLGKGTLHLPGPSKTSPKWRLVCRLEMSQVVTCWKVQMTSHRMTWESTGGSSKHSPVGLSRCESESKTILYQQAEYIPGPSNRWFLDTT